MRPCLIRHTETGEIKQYVKNLGWLYHHRSSVARVTVEYTSNYPYVDDVFMIAYLDDGVQFECDWASETVCRRWLNRRVFHEVPLVWLGKTIMCHRTEES